MAKHELLVVPVYPWQRVARTVVVDLLVWGPTTVVVVQELLDAAEQLRASGVLSAGVYGRVSATGAVALLVAGTVTRILALPSVDRVLQRIGLGTVPRAAANADVVATVKDTAAALEIVARTGRVDPPGKP